MRSTEINKTGRRGRGGRGGKWEHRKKGVKYRGVEEMKQNVRIKRGDFEEMKGDKYDHTCQDIS